MQKDKYIPRYTYADYCLWEGNWELIGGHAYAMSPSPFFSHQILESELLRVIGNALLNDACACKVVSEFDWIIDSENVVKPDVMIVCGGKIERHLEYAPTLIVEILSPSSAFRDQIIKKELYAEQGVKYYLIADTDKKTIMVFELVNAEYQIKSDAHIDLTDHCSITLDIDAIMSA